MFINGQWLTKQNIPSFPVFNPANGEKIGEAVNGGKEHAAEAIKSAKQALGPWASLTAYERSAFLYKAYQLTIERKEALAELMSKEQGKPLKAARNEVQYGADFFLWFAEEAKRIYGRTIPSPRLDQRFIMSYQAVGVVAAVTPWNYPVSMITRKVAPALAAGCSIVLKPAESTTLCAIEMFKILEQSGVPAGVVNLVTALDPKPIGEEFVENPDVAKITFTGSTEVGKKLAAKAAANMKRISLELGGHAPFVVFEDSDPVYAAKGLSLVKFLNTGQACISPNRIFVQRGVVEPFIEELSARVSKMRVGGGLEPGAQIGPLINESALAKIEGQVKDALDKGAELLVGGERLMANNLDKGVFYAPTILNKVTPDMLIYREETFGPVAPITIFDDEDEVLDMANDTRYGLASYVYTKDISRAVRMFEGLKFAIVGVNDINPTSAAAPFGGMKESGVGREGGMEGLKEYLELKIGGFSI